MESHCNTTGASDAITAGYTIYGRIERLLDSMRADQGHSEE